MSIASIRFATHARTWLLIAALTALLIGIGALLGGALLYLFAGLAAAMNVIGYWFSDRLRRKEQWPARDRRVPPGEECRRRPMWRSRLVDLVHCGRRTSFLSRGFVREQSRLDCLELALGERALRPQPRDFLELLDEFRR
jgi:hypothetical protein